MAKYVWVSGAFELGKKLEAVAEGTAQLTIADLARTLRVLSGERRAVRLCEVACNDAMAFYHRSHMPDQFLAMQESIGFFEGMRMFCAPHHLSGAMRRLRSFCQR